MTESKKGFEVRNRPDWLYNSLPYVYIAMGLAVVFGLGTSNLIGVFSGILLISTGGVVVTMRATHRQELAKLRAEFEKNEPRVDENEARKDEDERRKLENERRKNERRKSNDVSTPPGIL